VAAPVVTMTPKQAPRSGKYSKMAKEAAVRVVPALVVIALLMLFWELVCRRTGSTLPPPSKVFKDTKQLILDPFFDHGGIDKGLFWHLSASLQRVAFGYSIAAIVGIALGTLVGQSVWAMRGLDPLFQVLRTIPPLAWLPLSLAAFRDGQPSAIFVIFITSVWPIIINTAVGIRNIPQHRAELKETCHAGLSEARPHRQDLHPRQRHNRGAEGHQPDDREGRIRLDHRPFRLRQVHAAQHRRRPHRHHPGLRIAGEPRG